MNITWHPPGHKAAPRVAPVARRSPGGGGRGWWPLPWGMTPIRLSSIRPRRVRGVRALLVAAGALPGILSPSLFLSGGGPAVVAQELPSAATPASDGDTVETLDAFGVQPGALLEQAAEITELLAVYRRMPGLRDIRIRLDGRILEIEGRALSSEDRERALGYARTLVGGIVFIDDRGLQVETDVRRRLEPAMERIQEKGMAFLRFLPSLVLGLAILTVGALLAAWAGRWDRLFGRLARNQFARNLVRQVVRAVVFLVALLLALDLMGVTALVGAVLGAAGVAGIAVGFAFRDIVENYLAGVLLSLRQPFAPGDHVRMQGEEGRIVRLTGRETVLMTLDGNHVRVPNATVYKAVITNLTRNPRRRFLFQVGIAPSEALGPAIRIAREAVGGVSGVLEAPSPAVRIHELQDSAVALQVSGWVDQRVTDFGKTRSQAIRAVKEAFEVAGVATPPPEFGIRMLEAAGSDARPSDSGALPGGAGEGTVASPEKSARDEEPPADLAPDKTIEEEIARELETSSEENLLQPTPPSSSRPDSAGVVSPGSGEPGGS